MDRGQYQMGKTKIFIKNPESLFLLEEVRERKYDGFARKIQKAWRQFNARKHHAKQKEEACDLMYGKKERRRFSLNRNFVGDYIGLEYKPALQALVGKRERVDFAHTANKYDRRFKVSKVDLLVTSKHVTLIGREKVKKGPEKGKLVEVVKRQLELGKIASIGLSPYQDDFLVLQVRDDYSSLLETPFKTEFCTAVSKRYKEKMNGATLPLEFKNSHVVTLKKTRFGGGTRTVSFALEESENRAAVLKPNGKTLNVSIGRGLPNTTRPSMDRPSGGYKQRKDQLRVSGRRSYQTSQHRPAPVPHAQSQAQANTNSYAQPLPLHSNNGAMRPAAPSHQSQNRAASHDNNNSTIYPNQSAANKYGGVPTAFTGISNRVAPSENQAGPPARGPKPPPPAKPRLLPLVTALYAYDAQDTDELSFQAGDQIEVMNKDSSGWWQGKIGTRIGLFPGNYVRE